MKNLILITTTLLITSCSSSILDHVLDVKDGDPALQSSFQSSKEVCEKSNGTFDTQMNLCQCVLPTPFSEDSKCTNLGRESKGVWTFSSTDKSRELQIINEALLPKEEIETFIKSTTIPKPKNARIYIFKDLKQFKIKNSKKNLYYLNTNFYMSENSSETETQIYFAPVATPNLRAAGDHLVPMLSTILNSSLDKPANEFFYPKDSSNCLTGCYAARLITASENFNFIRLQTYYGGNKLFDTVRVSNKFDNKLDVILVLFNKKLSHYYKSTGNGFFTVYTNTGEIIDYAASLKEM